MTTRTFHHTGRDEVIDIDALEPDDIMRLYFDGDTSHSWGELIDLTSAWEEKTGRDFIEALEG